MVYRTADGQANAGTDYTVTAGTIRWAKGDLRPKTITVPLLHPARLRKGAAAPDFSLDFTVALSKLSRGTVFGYSSTALVTIVSPTTNAASFSAGGYLVAGNAGMLQVQVNRLGNGVGPLSVCYSTRGEGKTDFVDIPWGKKTLQWADGDKTPKTFTVTIPATATPGRSFNICLDDNGSNPDRTGSVVTPFLRAGVVIVNPNPAAFPGVLSFTGQTGMTMVGYGFAAAEYTVNGDAGSVTIPVSRLAGSAGAVSVKCELVKGVGTAIPGIDFLFPESKDAAAFTLDWADGDTKDKFITIPLPDRTAMENGKLTFWLHLDSPTGGAIMNFPDTAGVIIVEPGRK